MPNQERAYDVETVERNYRTEKKALSQEQRSAFIDLYDVKRVLDRKRRGRDGQNEALDNACRSAEQIADELFAGHAICAGLEPPQSYEADKYDELTDEQLAARQDEVRQAIAGLLKDMPDHYDVLASRLSGELLNITRQQRERASADMSEESTPADDEDIQFIAQFLRDTEHYGELPNLRHAAAAAEAMSLRTIGLDASVSEWRRFTADKATLFEGVAATLYMLEPEADFLDEPTINRVRLSMHESGYDVPAGPTRKLTPKEHDQLPKPIMPEGLDFAETMRWAEDNMDPRYVNRLKSAAERASLRNLPIEEADAVLEGQDAAWTETEPAAPNDDTYVSEATDYSHYSAEELQRKEAALVGALAGALDASGEDDDQMVDSITTELLAIRAQQMTLNGEAAPPEDENSVRLNVDDINEIADLLHGPLQEDGDDNLSQVVAAMDRFRDRAARLQAAGDETAFAKGRFADQKAQVMQDIATELFNKSEDEDIKQNSPQLESLRILLAKQQNVVVSPIISGHM